VRYKVTITRNNVAFESQIVRYTVKIKRNDLPQSYLYCHIDSCHICNYVTIETLSHVIVTVSNNAAVERYSLIARYTVTITRKEVAVERSKITL